MTGLSSEIIGDAYTSDFLWDLHQQLADIGNRMPGSQGEHHGTELLHRGFQRAGLDDARIEAFDIPTWHRKSATLDVSGPTSRTFAGSHEVLGLPGSPTRSVEGEVVDVGPGLPRSFESNDVRGKIAIVSSQNPPDYGRSVNRIEKYCLAEEHGAAGFLYYNDVPGCITPTGAIGFARDGTGSIPGLGVTREVSRRLRRWSKRGAVTATITVDADVGRGTSRNVEAVVGPDTGPEIIVSGHLDAHDVADGARDNAAGCVLAAEVGRLLTAVDDLETRVRIVAFGAEETGLYGSHHWTRANDPADVACQVNIDGIGFTRTLGVVGDETMSGAFRRAADELGVPVHTARGLTPFTDAWSFGREGVPVVNCESATEGSGQVVRYGHREWGHTHADTLDKLDRRDMRDLAIQLAAGVAEVASTDRQPQRRTAKEVHDSLPASVREYLHRSGRVDRYRAD